VDADTFARLRFVSRNLPTEIAFPGDCRNAGCMNLFGISLDHSRIWEVICTFSPVCGIYIISGD